MVACKNMKKKPHQQQSSLFIFDKDVKEYENSSEVKPACDPLDIQQPEAEPDIHTIEKSTRKRQVCTTNKFLIMQNSVCVIVVLRFLISPCLFSVSTCSVQL